MNSKQYYAIYFTPQHIFAEIIQIFHFCQVGFCKWLKSSMGILLDEKNMVNQDENTYSKLFPIVIKPGKSFIRHVIYDLEKGIVI